MATLSAGMRMERGPRLPDPFRIARVAPCAYSANQDADAGTVLPRLHEKTDAECLLCAAFEANISEVATGCRDPEQTALSLRVSTERMLTHRLSCSFLQSHGSVTFGSAASAWHFPVPKSILTFFSKVQRPHCSRHLESVCENGCVGGCSSPKICAFKLSEGITDISLLCFWVLLVSFSKYPPATRVADAQPRSLEMPLGALPATTAGGQ